MLLHAADLCGGKYRMKLNAATMLGQGKNIVQVIFNFNFLLIDEVAVIAVLGLKFQNSFISVHALISYVRD